MAKGDLPTLAQLMDPKFQVKQAKYENARGAIVAGYRLASEALKWTDVPTQEGVKKFADVARMFAKEYQKDLDDTLKILDDTDGKTKSA